MTWESFLLCFEAWNFFQCRAELTVVHFDAVVKIDGDFLLRERIEDVTFVGVQFSQHRGVFVDQLQIARLFRRSEGGTVVFGYQMLAMGANLGNKLPAYRSAH